MVMAERYGIPSTKIISLMSAWKVPFRNVQAGDRLLVMTDDSMDRWFGSRRWRRCRSAALK
jgi:hypothetical protein